MPYTPDHVFKEFDDRLADKNKVIDTLRARITALEAELGEARAQNTADAMRLENWRRICEEREGMLQVSESRLAALSPTKTETK